MRGNGLVQVLFNSLEGLDTLPMESLNVGERFQTFVRRLLALSLSLSLSLVLSSFSFSFSLSLSFSGLASWPWRRSPMYVCVGHNDHFQIAYLKLYTQYCSNYEIAHSRLVSLKEAKWEVRRS
jgi:hypothetical protein